MRFLIDMPLTPSLAVHLRTSGHDAVHASDIGESQATDSALLLRARAEERVVITADLDFARLMAEIPQTTPGIILLRGGSYSDQQMIELVDRALHGVDPGLIPQSLIVVDRHRVRRRPLPLA